MSLTKNDIKEMLGGFGCLSLILIVAALLLLVVPALLFLSACISGGLIWLGWNLALVPIFGLAPINFFWQAWGLGLLVSMLTGMLKGIVVKKGD